jgi:pyruvyltransferase
MSRELRDLPHPVIELTYWRPDNGVNFGDELSRVIVELMLAHAGRTIFDSVSTPRQMLAVGSYLHGADTGAVIWGTGINGNALGAEHRYASLDVRAVRGPLTRKFLLQRSIPTPEIFGDPALLLPNLAGKRFSPTGEYAVALVPNLYDLDYVITSGLLNAYPEVGLIDPMRAWNVVVTDILKYRLVLASSLHGLIVAEAYGIPARFVRLTPLEGELKYADYYEGTGRTYTCASSLQEALELGGEPAPKFDCMPLMQAFPYDIWDL